MSDCVGFARYTSSEISSSSRKVGVGTAREESELLLVDLGVTVSPAFANGSMP